MNHTINANSYTDISDDNKPNNTKKEAPSFFRRFGIYILLTLAAISAIITLFCQESTLHEKNLRKEELTSQLKEAESLEKEHESELNYAGSDDYAEDVARDKMGWVKDDELVFKEGENDSSSEGEK